MEQVTYKFSVTRYNYESAKKILSVIVPLLPKVSSVLDLGCGLGAWSSVLEEQLNPKLELIDHPATPIEELLVEDKSVFKPLNLDISLPCEGQRDMILCIEVLEHFKEEVALRLHDFICNSTDLVLFSAAVPGQGGIGHINCRRHSYWHDKFSNRGFKYFDGFKSEIVHDQAIPFWLRQNLFIYYRDNYSSYFKGRANYTPEGFELIHSGMLKNEIGLKVIVKHMPSLLIKFISRKLHL